MDVKIGVNVGVGEGDGVGVGDGTPAPFIKAAWTTLSLVELEAAVAFCSGERYFDVPLLGCASKRSAAVEL